MNSTGSEELYDIPEGLPYAVRSVTDGRWRYIRNLAPQNSYIEKHLITL